MAKVLAVRGDLDGAERLAREAVVLANGTDYINMRGNRWMRLGEFLRLAGKQQDAGEALGEALALYERKGNVVMAERARSELADLRGMA